MVNQNDVSYFYENENKKEYLNFISKKGSKNILCIGIHPREEDNITLLDEVVKSNGYDGWVLAFLYPKVCDATSMLDIEPDNNLLNRNLSLISTLISRNHFNFDSVLLLWGDGIDSFNQTYLKESAYYLHRRIANADLKFFSIGIPKRSEHPLSITSLYKFKKFDFEKYALHIKNTLNLKPEVTLNGIEFK